MRGIGTGDWALGTAESALARRGCSAFPQCPVPDAQCLLFSLRRDRRQRGLAPRPWFAGAADPAHDVGRAVAALLWLEGDVCVAACHRADEAIRAGVLRRGLLGTNHSNVDLGAQRALGALAARHSAKITRACVGVGNPQAMRQAIGGIDEQCGPRGGRRRGRTAGVSHADADGRALGIGGLGICLHKRGDGPDLPFKLALGRVLGFAGGLGHVLRGDMLGIRRVPRAQGVLQRLEVAAIQPLLVPPRLHRVVVMIRVRGEVAIGSWDALLGHGEAPKGSADGVPRQVAKWHSGRVTTRGLPHRALARASRPRGRAGDADARPIDANERPLQPNPRAMHANARPIVTPARPSLANARPQLPDGRPKHPHGRAVWLRGSVAGTREHQRSAKKGGH